MRTNLFLLMTPFLVKALLAPTSRFLKFPSLLNAIPIKFDADLAVALERTHLTRIMIPLWDLESSALERTALS